MRHDASVFWRGNLSANGPGCIKLCIAACAEAEWGSAAAQCEGNQTPDYSRRPIQRCTTRGCQTLDVHANPPRYRAAIRLAIGGGGGGGGGEGRDVGAVDGAQHPCKKRQKHGEAYQFDAQPSWSRRNVCTRRPGRRARLKLPKFQPRKQLETRCFSAFAC